MQVAYTLADRVLTPANQQVKVLDVKEARPACIWAPQHGSISSVHGPPSVLEVHVDELDRPRDIHCRELDSRLFGR